MQRETPVDWTETSTPQIFNKTRPHMSITQTNRWETIYITPCTDYNTCTNKWKTIIYTNYTLEYSECRLEKVFRSMKIGNWNKTNTALCASRFSPGYSSTNLEKIVALNTNFTPHQCVLPIHSSGLNKWKLQNCLKHLTTKTAEKDELN